MRPNSDSQTNERPESAAAIDRLISLLSSSSGLKRQDARRQLERFGGPAVGALIEVLKSSNEQARWEAAKALVKIRDPRAAPELVHALEDPEFAVRWLAAEGLVALGHHALIPLLKALEDESDSVWMREGARHVLHSLIGKQVTKEVKPVLEALEDIEPSIKTPIAAFKALQELGGEVKYGQQG